MRLRRTCLLASALLLVGCRGGGPPADTAPPPPPPSPGVSDAVAGAESARCSEALVRAGDCVVLGVLGVGRAGSDAESDDTDRILRVQRAFWARVNESGGIGGVRVDVRAGAGRQEALAFLGASEVTAPPMAGLPDDAFVAGALPATSRWLFEDRVLQTGASACIQAMNAVDVLVFRGTEADLVAVVHLDDELGRDAAAGSRLTAERRGIGFLDLPMSSASATGDVVEALVSRAPDIVVLATTPTATRAVVVGAAQGGFAGDLVTTNRGWDRSLLTGPGSEVIADRLVIATPWREFTLASSGHGAMRAALGDVEPDEAYTAGWIGSYPMLALLREAQASGDLTRAGMVEAAHRLDDVEYDGMYPPRIGTPFSGGPAAQAAVRTAFAVPDPDVPLGTVAIEDYFNGLTVALHEFDRPCFEEE